MTSIVRCLPALTVFLSFAPPGYSQETPAPVAPVPPTGTSVPAPVIVPAAPVAPALPVAAPVATHYTVQAGDNPWSIAKKHGVDLQALLKANEIKDPKSLKVGDVLKLPAPTAPGGGQNPAAVQAPASAPVEEPPADAEWEWYTIQSGDNPWKVAKQRKVAHGKIVSLNKGVDFTRLSVGQKIKVPKAP